MRLKSRNAIHFTFLLFLFSAIPAFSQDNGGGYSIETNAGPEQFPREYKVRYHVNNQSKILAIGLTNVDFGKVSVLLSLESVSESSAVVRVQSFELSNFTIPSLPVRVLSGTRTNTVMTPEVFMEQNKLQSPVSNMAPIEEIFSVSDPAVLILIILTVLVLGVGGLLAYRVFIMKQKKGLTLDDRIDPYEEALKNLNRLKQTEWNEKNPKEIYMGVWETVRRFLDRVFGFPALEMSTSEIIGHFRKSSGGGLDEIQDIALHILKVCDRVKYAKYRPEKDQKDQTLSDSFELVRRTRDHFESLKTGPEQNGTPDKETGAAL